MAYKSLILKRYQNSVEENDPMTLNHELFIVMHNKFSKLEEHIQKIKQEIHIKSSFINRTNKFEQMFLTVKTGIQFLMEDLKKILILRDSANGEMTAMQERVQEQTRNKKELLFSLEKRSGTMKFKKGRKYDTKLTSNLNGMFWTTPRNKKRTKSKRF